MNSSYLISAAIVVSGLVLFWFAQTTEEPVAPPAADATVVANDDAAAREATDHTPAAALSAQATPAPVAVLDTDRDGVRDADDRCPGSRAGFAVDSSGCGLDGDGDGVADSNDACPDTAAAVAVDETGCRQRLRSVLVFRPEVKFGSSSAAVDATAVLAELSSVLAELGRYPESQVRVLAFTDNSGRAEMNQELSARRAAAIAAVLTGPGGIASERVQAIGRGEADPLVSNATPEGRALNRRVEVLVKPGDA